MQETIKDIISNYFPSKRTPEENKAYCEKYPFLAWYGDPLYMGYSEAGEPDYDYTWEDEIPVGWQKAFCPIMWDELKEILERHNYLKEFRFAQIKEKWGELVIYFNAAPEGCFEEVEAWADKYLKLSSEHCISCGKPTKYMTLGWITFVCEDCAKKSNKVCVDIKDIDNYYNTPMEQRSKFYVEFGEEDD